jgi:hypothetical protein
MMCIEMQNREKVEVKKERKNKLQRTILIGN